MPRPAKMSPILPMATTVVARPRSARSSSVRAGGGTREVVAVRGAREIARRVPTNGRAITRPMPSRRPAARDLADARRAAPGRTAPRARRSGTRCRPRCSRSACRSAMCSSPSSSMICVPEAWRSPRMPGSSPAFAQRVDQLGGKARLRAREIAPVERDRHAGDLPVAGRRVLAGGDLARSRRRAVGAGCAASRPGGTRPVAQPAGFAEAERDEIGQIAAARRAARSRRLAGARRPRRCGRSCRRPHRRRRRHPARRRCRPNPARSGMRAAHARRARCRPARSRCPARSADHAARRTRRTPRHRAAGWCGAARCRGAPA